MKAVLILSFQKEANVRAVAVTDGIHGIQKMIGSALTGKGGEVGITTKANNKNKLEGSVYDYMR